MGSGHSSQPQPQAALGLDGITPGSLQDTRVPVTSVPENLLSWWAPSPVFSSPWVSPSFVPHPCAALPLHFGSFWAVWAPWSISTHEGLLTPAAAEDAK